MMMQQILRNALKAHGVEDPSDLKKVKAEWEERNHSADKGARPSIATTSSNLRHAPHEHCCDATNGQVTLRYSAQLQGNLPGTTTQVGNDPNGNDTPSGDNFGTGISINEERDELLISALGASVQGKLKVGAIYYFREDGNGCPQIDWRQFQPPTYNPNEEPEAFGYNRLGGIVVTTQGRWAFYSLAGTPDNLDADQFSQKNNLGEVIVFRREPGGSRDCRPWRLFQKIPNPAPSIGSNPEFGLNMAYNGGDWLLVGGGRTLTSFLYKYQRRLKQWVLVNTLRPPSATTTDPGNLVVQITDEYAFVGSPQVFTGIQLPGQVNVYRKVNDDMWTATYDPATPTQTLAGINVVPDAGSDFFGGIMATDGKRLLVGAPGDSEAGFFAGAAYVFRLSDYSGLWVLEQKLLPPATPPSPDPFNGPFLFGFSCAIRGKLAVVGNPFGKPDGIDGQGSAIVYNRSGSVQSPWLQVQVLADPNPQAFVCFGGAGSALSPRILALGTGNATNIFAPPLTVPGRVIIFDVVGDVGAFEDEEHVEDDGREKERERSDDSGYSDASLSAPRCYECSRMRKGRHRSGHGYSAHHGKSRK